MPTKSDDPWPAIRTAALGRAHNRCQECGVEQYSTVMQHCRTLLCDPPPGKRPCSVARENAAFYHEPEERAVVAVLSVVRLNGLELDTRPENLRCLCQLCLNRHTAPKRAELLRLKSKKTKEARDLKKQSRFGFALI